MSNDWGKKLIFLYACLTLIFRLARARRIVFLKYVHYCSKTGGISRVGTVWPLYLSQTTSIVTGYCILWWIYLYIIHTSIFNRATVIAQRGFQERCSLYSREVHALWSIENELHVHSRAFNYQSRTIWWLLKSMQVRFVECVIFFCIKYQRKYLKQF